MTIVIPANSPQQLQAYKYWYNGEEGFMVSLNGQTVFVKKEDAQKLGAYFSADSDTVSVAPEVTEGDSNG